MKSVSNARIFDLINIAIAKRDNLNRLTNAMRLVNGKGDCLSGLTLDRYNRHFVIQVFSLEWVNRINEIKDFVIKNLEPQYLIVKDRTSPSGRSLDNPSVDVAVVNSSSETEVMENGIKFIVNLNDTVNTGLFLDMRRNRKLIASLSKGKSVLNCFAYTCSFGVYCRLYGAKEVLNVDISNKCLKKGKANYALNDIPYSDHDFIRGDCMQYLLRYAHKNRLFDMVILDPPSFSRYEGRVFSVKKDMVKLIGQGIRILKPQGHLFAATNFSGLSTPMLTGFIKKNAGVSGRTIKKLTPLGQDTDFPGSGLVKESYLAAVLANFSS